jgi:hypothetical protein
MSTAKKPARKKPAAKSSSWQHGRLEPFEPLTEAQSAERQQMLDSARAHRTKLVNTLGSLGVDVSGGRPQTASRNEWLRDYTQEQGYRSWGSLLRDAKVQQLIEHEMAVLDMSGGSTNASTSAPMRDLAIELLYRLW